MAIHRHNSRIAWTLIQGLWTVVDERKTKLRPEQQRKWIFILFSCDETAVTAWDDKRRTKRRISNQYHRQWSIWQKLFRWLLQPATAWCCSNTLRGLTFGIACRRHEDCDGQRYLQILAYDSLRRIKHQNRMRHESLSWFAVCMIIVFDVAYGLSFILHFALN